MLYRKASAEKKGGSFHFRLDRHLKWAEKDGCPVCNAEQQPADMVTIKEMNHSWLEASSMAQGCLWGKCHVLSKKHYVTLYDMNERDLLNFMVDVQKAARALQIVTGAFKINYEIHGNSVPHLHCHLFPRYLNDLFPSAPIDYRKVSPNPYAEESFDYFVQAMRKELSWVPEN